MSEIGEAVKFACHLYRQQAGTALAAYVRRDKLAMLTRKPGRVDPYSIYEQLRAAGPVLPGRYGGRQPPAIGCATLSCAIAGSEPRHRPTSRAARRTS